MSIAGTDFLAVDDFVDNLPTMTGAGWVVNNYSRYNPTHIDGLTPTGKTFSIDASGSTITFTIAGNTRSRTVTPSLWLQGAAFVTQWQASYAAFPKAQQ